MNLKLIGKLGIVVIVNYCMKVETIEVIIKLVLKMFLLELP